MLYVKKYPFHILFKGMCNPNFNIFLNQHSNVYLEKDGIVKRSVHVSTICRFFLDDSIDIFVRYTCVKNNVGTHIPLMV